MRILRDRALGRWRTFWYRLDDWMERHRPFSDAQWQEVFDLGRDFLSGRR